MRRAAQLTEHENPPQQSPQLVRVRERNPARDPRILDGVLLEQISNDPYETARQKPEENVTSARQLRPERTRPTGVRECERRHHPELSDSEKSDEGERAHSGEIGFAIGDVHRPPQHAGTQRGGNSTSRIVRRYLRGRCNRQSSCSGEHEQRTSDYSAPTAPVGAAK